MTDDSANLPLAKYLASTDKKTRDKAVKSLANYLSANRDNELPKSEMAKLWKGIFYCYWMSDKPLVQQALSSVLADLLLLISSTDAALAFLNGFWEAILREWSGIDRLRMDKYYMLVRKFVNATFRLLLRAEWEESALDTYNEMLTRRGSPLCFDDSRVPSSLTYHISDIYLEELEKVLSAPDDDEQQMTLPAPVIPLFNPFFTLAAHTSSSITYSRVYTSFIEPFLTALTEASAALSAPTEPPARKRLRRSLSLKHDFECLLANSCIDSPKDGRTEPLELRRAFLRSMFDIASGPDVKESNRKKLYAVWRTAMAEDDDDERVDAS